MSSKWDPLTDMPDLKGKVVVVTGANSGMGLAMVKFMALRGAKVYLTARSKDKAEHARQSLQSSNPELDQDQIIWLSLDLSDLRSVRAAAEELKKKENKVDILINNAGVATASTETAGHGWEWHMAVCHVGHFLFTNSVLPLLKTATKEKDSDSYEFTFDSPSFLSNPVPYYPMHWRLASRHIFTVDMIRYAVSKVANLLFAQELQRLMDEQESPIISISVNPGGVASDGTKAIGGYLFSLLRSTFLTVDQGAVTPLFAATATEVRRNADTFKGKYLEPFGQIVTPHPVSKDEKQIRGMWDNTTIQVNKYLAEIELAPLEAW
ncbi:daunorubicin C-13 ketoreductase [Colletotrichum karsti]|uniref:Daunorubicin C-13 ketoreductase n=1 Tax=Colletotrichum karsti TaxID=1095194 RepID=A0A9P6LHE9_9PEZI|nr:daunorubicin C-13 ketoreductase [Colletotrichum karsti]KAF9872492.1 daunorubicin C-13 ketoreductase [Colletotrichum karsti]